MLDRSGLILDIFAQRARSREGKLEVELAQLKHIASRLVRGWTHLERQRGGGIGNRGPGETQLETDRRLLGKRVEDARPRGSRRSSSSARPAASNAPRFPIPSLALVGYTNAGKSTLFRALTGADAYIADQLFATLDPTGATASCCRAIRTVVVADTVGFIRELPHELVAAFQSTLTEAREATLLLHVVDVSDPRRDEHIDEVNRVLAEIGAPTCRRSWCSTRSTASTRRRASSATNRASVSHVWLSAMPGPMGLDLLRECGGRAPVARGAPRDAAPAGVGRRTAGAAVRRRTWCCAERIADDGAFEIDTELSGVRGCSNGRASRASKF